MSDTAAVDSAYDNSGQWPITSDGWQIEYLGRSLFPGGPGACRVVSPMGLFYFGLSFDPPFDPRTVVTAVVTQLGRSSIKLPYHFIFESPALIQSAREKVQAYLAANASLFHPTPFHRVEFRPGDGKHIDIF